MSVEKSRGCMKERLQSVLAPKECPIPTMGRGIEARKWLIMWRRSRGWSLHAAGCMLFRDVYFERAGFVVGKLTIVS